MLSKLLQSLSVLIGGFKRVCLCTLVFYHVAPHIISLETEKTVANIQIHLVFVSVFLRNSLKALNFKWF